MIALVSRKTGISKSNVGMLADVLGYNDLYTLITGKDAVTGKPRSRVLAGALTAFNFMPVSKVLAVAKFAKVIAVAGVAGKFAAHASVARKAAAVTGFAVKRVIGKKAEKKAAKLAMEEAQKKIARNAAKKIGKNTAREVKHEATHRAGAQLANHQVKNNTTKVAVKVDTHIGKSVKVLGRGHTGRYVAKNSVENLAMKEVKSNPLKYSTEVPVPMTDSRWLGKNGWVKKQRVVESGKHKTVIHFVYNTKTHKFDDFKYK